MTIRKWNQTIVDFSEEEQQTKKATEETSNRSSNFLSDY